MCCFLVDFAFKKVLISRKINKNELSIVLDLQSKSLPQLHVQTNSLELVSINH